MTVRKVAAAQLSPASSDKAETVARMVDLLDEAGRQGVEFVVFPELRHTGDVLARSASDGDDLVVAEIDFAAAADARARLDLATNRRSDQYSAISAEYSLAGSLS